MFFASERTYNKNRKYNKLKYFAMYIIAKNTGAIQIKY